jgi:hypothetical protein
MGSPLGGETESGFPSDPLPVHVSSQDFSEEDLHVEPVQVSSQDLSEEDLHVVWLFPFEHWWSIICHD